MKRFKEFLAEANDTTKSLEELRAKILSKGVGDIVEYNGTKIKIVDASKNGDRYCLVNPDADMLPITCIYKDNSEGSKKSLAQIEKLVKYGSKTSYDYYSDFFAYAFSMPRYSMALAIFWKFNWKKYGIDISKYEADEDGITIETGAEENNENVREFKKALKRFEDELDKTNTYVFTYLTARKGKLYIDVAKGEQLMANDNTKVY